MHPSWSNYGGGHQRPPNQFGVRGPHFRGPQSNAGGFGGYDSQPVASPSNFSSLREQHLQQMQQLQQLHQKQLQSVLHNNSGSYGSGPGVGAFGSWQGPGVGFSNPGNENYFHDHQQQPMPGHPGPTPPLQSQQQQEKGAQPPLPPNSASQQPLQTNSAPVPPKTSKADTPQYVSDATGSSTGKSDVALLSLEEQQQYYYKQHLQNLQRLKNEKTNKSQTSVVEHSDKNHKEGAEPPPPTEPPKSAPPPPLPKEEPPPPPPPEESKPTGIVDPGDPAETARLQQLQAAAAQWQHVQHQRASYQYQALMQQHSQLQQVLHQYQQVIQQPPHIQTMPIDMQLQHYEMQQQQFSPVFQDWDRHFKLWQEQFQTYPHKDELKDYECQWKQWQEQMSSTSMHLQERVSTLRTMQHQLSSHPYGVMVGQYEQSVPSSMLPPTNQEQSATAGQINSSVLQSSTAQNASQGQAYPPTGPGNLPEPHNINGTHGHGVRPPVPGVGPSGPGARPLGPGVRPVGPGSGPSGPGVRPAGPGVGLPGPGVRPPGPGSGPSGPGVRPAGPGVGLPGPGVRPPGPGSGPSGPGVRPAGPGVGLPGPGVRPPGPGSGPPGPGLRPPRPGVGPPGPGVRPPGPGIAAFGPGGRPTGPGCGPPGRGVRLPGPGPGPPGPGVRPVGPGAGPPGPGFRPAGPGAGPPGLRCRPPGPGAGQVGPQIRPPGPQVRVDGPRGPRFEGPRGIGGPRYENPPHQTFSAPSRFETRPQFGQFPRGDCHRPGASGRIDLPPRQNPPTHFERLPEPSSLSDSLSQGKQDPVSQSRLQQAKSDGPSDAQSHGQITDKKTFTPQGQPMKDDVNADQSMSDDILDSGDGFFVQSDPIPQTSGKMKESKKTEDPVSETANADNSKMKENSKPSIPTSSPALQKLTTPTVSKEAPLNNSMKGSPPRAHPSPHGPPTQDIYHEYPDSYMEENQVMGPHVARGRGRGCGPLTFRGRGRGRGGFFHAPQFDPNSQEENIEVQYEHMPPQEVAHGQEDGFEWNDPSFERSGRIDDRRPPHEEMWQPDEHFTEEYYEDDGGRAPPMGQFDQPEGPERPWEDQKPEYWEAGGSYWPDRRPPMRPRLPFPSEEQRRPPFQPGFMHHGPRRPPPPPGHLEHGPQGPRFHPMHRDPVGPPIRHGFGPRGPPPHHDGIERDTRRPPPPHEILDRNQRGPPGYHNPMDREPGWSHPPGRDSRRPPVPPHEMMEARRPPARPHSMERERWHRPHLHENAEGDYEQDWGDEFGREEDGFRGPPHDHQQDEDYHYYHSQDEWDMEHSDRDFPRRPTHGPAEHDGRRSDKRDREYPYEGEERVRLERWRPGYPDDPPFRVREFQSRPDWERSPPPPPPPSDREYPHSMDGPQFERKPGPPVELRSISSQPPPSSLTDPALEQSSPGATKGVVALSQRQHEIILKAAQELKMIRELQEGKNAVADVPRPESTGMPPELSTALLGLEIPPEVKTALQSTNMLTQHGQIVSCQPTSVEAGRVSSGFPLSQPPTAAAVTPKPPLIAKTVDYGHGHDVGATVERMSYGERIVLRPDPLPSDRPYEKEPLGPRGPYSRDPYYDRRNCREWDRDMYRETPPQDYDRERYDRDRFARDERLPPRPGYRDREREPRDLQERTSRDRELYGRLGYERPPRVPERYEHAPSGYGNDKRSYPDDRPHISSPSLPPPPPVAQRIEKKPETKNVEDLLKLPGRANRPDRIVIIMRGLPGSGKSHLAKLIRDKEVECGGAPPRVLGLDDYFMTEVEKVEKDPDTGKRVKAKVLEYEYEPEMEETYRSSMLKTFKKTLDDGFFPFIIIDAINDKVKYFDQFWSAAKTKGFEVYLAEITTDHQICAKRNIHERTLKDVTKLASSWEPAPRHMVRLDIRSLLQDAAIEEVEMEDFNPTEEEVKAEPKKEEEEEGDLGYIPKSKWEMDTSEGKLDKLDGLMCSGKRKRDSDGMSGMEDFLQLPDDYATRMSEPGKKRVRWADLEEQKDADRKRAIGFIVGQTDWEKITDESGQLAQKALNRTKYF